MKTKFKLIIIAGIFILLSINSVLALGITPGRTTINFQPGLHKEISFSIINSENKDMSVVFFVRGDLNNSVTLEKVYEEFSSSDESKSFTYTIDLPQSLSEPGKYETEIVALETPKDIKQKGTFVGATVAVITQLHVYVPYPNKYLEAEVNVIESAEDREIIFLIPVINRGKLDIVDAIALIDIYSGAGDKIKTITSDSVSLASLERKEMVAKWKLDVNPGRYKAVVTLRYDDETTSISKEFNVGEMFLEILEINIKDFELGGIAKFDSFVENKWSEDLKDVYLNIIVYNDEGEIMADFKSPNYEIGALSKMEIIAYWDTAGVKKGTYDGKLILKYGERSTERDIQLKITDDSIKVMGITGHVTVKSRGAFSLTNILIMVIILLIVVNIIWFIVVKKMMKRRKT